MSVLPAGKPPGKATPFTCRLTKEKGFKFIGLEETLRDTVKSLEEKGFYKSDE